MSVSLTPKQTLILWFLISEGGGALRGEVRPEPSTVDRNALEKGKLVASEKRGRALWLEVTDAGWAWANDNLNAKLPAKTQSAGPILQAWLTLLHSFLRRNGITLAEIVAPASEELGSKPAPLQERLSRAYLTAAGGAWNARVRLSELRGRLIGNCCTCSNPRSLCCIASTTSERSRTTIEKPPSNRR
jgi:hypothetical protein